MTIDNQKPAPLAPREPRPQDIIKTAVDRWDATARLEASGFSDRAARVAGQKSSHEWARGLIDEHGLPGAQAVSNRRRQTSLLWAAIGRALIMLAGVVVCVSTMPRQSTEVVVFVVAATGWVTGMSVSAALWHCLGRGRAADAIRGAVLTSVAMLIVGNVAAIALREVTVLIWVGWACAIPILLTLRPGRRLVAATVAAGALCATAWMYGTYPQTVSVAAVATATAVVVAAQAAHKTLGRVRARHIRGTALAVLVALAQTLAQLGFLLIVFVRIGPGAFAAVAIAGLAAGVLADPLFALARMWAIRFSQLFHQWLIGRIVISAVGPPLVAALCVTAVAVVRWVLQDPYRVYLDEGLAVMAGIVAACTASVINALLRTGAAVGAMLFALGVSAFSAFALRIQLPTDDPWHSLPFTIATITTVVLACAITTHRLSRPQAW